MTDVPDISACIALARDAKNDIDDVVRLAGSAKVWNNVQDLADAVLALAERVRELERDIGESAIDASAEHARVVAFLEHQADLRADDKSAWAALKGGAFAIKGREHDKCLKALQASLQARAAAKATAA